MTPRELEAAARALVTRWTSEGGATASHDWLYRTEEDSLVSLIAAALTTVHDRGLETAAELADSHGSYGPGVCQEIAAAIRALRVMP